MNEKYKSIYNVISSVIENETNLVANLANVSAILMAELKHHWIGFYLVDSEKNELVLGPFQGPMACTRIPYGKGVCGSSWSKKETLIVPDVHAFEGHIACSSLSNSEIVIPIIKGGDVLAILDIDSINFSEFNAEDSSGLEEICHLLSQKF